MVYVVCYDLNRPNQDYVDLIKALEKMDSYHPQKSVWYVSSTLGAAQIYDQLNPFIDDNDFLMVHEVVRHYAGYMPVAFWDWLGKRL